MSVVAEEIPIHVSTTEFLDRDGSPDVNLAGLQVTPTVGQPFADIRYQEPKLRGVPQELAVSHLNEIVEKPKGIKQYTMHHRYCAMEPCTAGSSPTTGHVPRTIDRELPA